MVYYPLEMAVWIYKIYTSTTLVYAIYIYASQIRNMRATQLCCISLHEA